MNLSQKIDHVIAVLFAVQVTSWFETYDLYKSMKVHEREAKR
jgi:hypothetical protein